MYKKNTRKQIHRQMILDAAGQLFAGKGIEETSMDDIAAAANYTRRTLYAYFKSRDEICLAVFIDQLISRWAYQKEQLITAKSGFEKIITWARSFYRYSLDHPQSLKMSIYWDYKGIDRNRISLAVFKSFKIINDELADGLRDIFNLGLIDGSLRPDLEVEISISQFLYCLRSIVNRAVSPGYTFTRFKPDKYVDNYLTLYQRAICNSGDK